jgi:methylphosphotriester-DNA--protein-cysteine methyltransferase
MDTGMVQIPAIEKILPDGCIDILFRINHGTNGSLSISSFVVGTMTTALDVPRGNSDIIAVRFLPGGALPFLRTPAHEFTDQAAALSSIVGDRINSLTDEILNEPSPSRRVKLLEKRLLSIQHSSGLIDSEFSQILNGIEKQMGVPSIDNLVGAWGKSTRHLERLFLGHVGVNPKFYLRVKRFQEVAKYLRGPFLKLSWADLAVKHGYFDQSHLIRDCKALTGLTPEKYRKFLEMSHFSNTPSPTAITVFQKGERHEF